MGKLHAAGAGAYAADAASCCSFSCLQEFFEHLTGAIFSLARMEVELPLQAGGARVPFNNKLRICSDAVMSELLSDPLLLVGRCAPSL